MLNVRFFFKKKKKFRFAYFVYIVLLACLSVYHRHAQCRRRSEEGLDPSELELQTVLS